MDLSEADVERIAAAAVKLATEKGVNISEADVVRIADVAAETAIRDLFLTIGVNVSTPESILELQKDFAHIRNRRKNTSKVLLGTVTALCVSAASAAGVYLTRGPHQ